MNQSTCLKWGTAIFLCFLVNFLSAQQPAQSIRGKVVDADTKMGIPGANIVVLNSQPLVGVATDVGGNFKFPKATTKRGNIPFPWVSWEQMLLRRVLSVKIAKRVT